ncbi:bMERB domain-containing protein 1 isoform X4 [Caretta caretta]|uniref:bMERB domain-containing protein 1 isoform X4 n=1 Tax=Caretta caretta TaxID=8467 RepID=UPI002095AAB8|nr:mpv17-like protein isoform X3 [Caretta caretta]
MAGPLLRSGVRRFPWLCNVLLYGSLFSAGDAAQQLLRRRPGQEPDWAQTRHVALVALSFHGNFNYVWLRGLERALPGRAPGAVLAKVLCDQLVGAPVAILAFYTDWTDVLAFCAAFKLRSGPCLLENSLHWALWLSLGYLHLLFTTER